MRVLKRVLTLAFLLVSGAAGAVDERGMWVMIDTDAHLVQVYRHQAVIATFHDAAIGSRGSSWLRREGDATTPLGDFLITHIKRDSRFHIFLGLDYPNQEHIDRAYRAGLLSDSMYQSLLKIVTQGYDPPQNTILGGNIGIHGIGRGDLAVHLRYDWTRGCIALTNEQIEELTKLIRIGTPVVIR